MYKPRGMYSRVGLPHPYFILCVTSVRSGHMYGVYKGYSPSLYYALAVTHSFIINLPMDTAVPFGHRPA